MGVLDGFKTKKEEGFRANVYKDTLGNNTVGTGFNVSDPSVAQFVPPGVVSGERPISTTEDNEIFEKLFANAENDAITYIGKDTYNVLSPNQRSALVDMSFNLGLPRLMKFEKFKEALITGDMNRAAAEIKNSKYYRQVPNRAERNIKLLLEATNAKP